MNTYQSILKSYLKNKSLYAHLMIGIIVQIPFWFLITTKPFEDSIKLYMPIMIAVIMGCFALIVITSSVTYLKSQITTSLGLILPGGRMKPLIVTCWIIFFSFIVLMIASTRIPDYSMLGLFSLTFFLLAGFVFFYYLHGFFALCFVLYAFYQHAFMVDMFFGNDLQYAPLMIVAGVIIFACFAYRVLSITEENWEFKTK